MGNDKLVKKWLEGSLSEAEKESFKQTKDYKSLNRLSNALLSFKPNNFSVEEELKRLATINSSKKGKVITFNMRNPLLRIAASILLVFSIGYVIYLNNIAHEEEYTTANSNTEFYLPDSSFVALNVHSKLTYSTKKWHKLREVHLKGEAFFKVAPGSNFDVKTTSGIISVLGTEFNVKNRDDYFEVTCYEGLVQVAVGEKIFQLGTNQSLGIIAGKIYEQIDLANYHPGWLDGESSFKSIPFYLVLEEFEREFDVTIVAQDLDLKQSFTGGFDNKDINIALKSITTPGNFGYQIKKDTIVLFSKE